MAVCISPPSLLLKEKCRQQNCPHCPHIAKGSKGEYRQGEKGTVKGRQAENEDSIRQGGNATFVFYVRTFYKNGMPLSPLKQWKSRDITSGST